MSVPKSEKSLELSKGYEDFRTCVTVLCSLVFFLKIRADFEDPAVLFG